MASGWMAMLTGGAAISIPGFAICRCGLLNVTERKVKKIDICQLFDLKTLGQRKTIYRFSLAELMTNSDSYQRNACGNHFR
ncbi:hypothetical protein E1890_08635 [Salmonella enterica subsp. enterica serovar Mountpleasant]|nr:hypothetical protein [Salmonella enterica]ECD9503624.1 hypothetical protein [Salmonella enterica subsp. diarizonae]ECF1389154.1 hypothetical protein [Salmonella enterica subsp. enterica serovar Stanley]ECF2364768.1 hypothetical protein [Salmonella enterica subsp. enterica serovar Mountpleasant]EDQ2393510.1 hypothetical protein [Salmonella enterica subsp. enterica]EEL9491858.1 hypothetical protein [Salmonella enterica subsp. enterica serovar Singapore]HAE8383374.1 hypothetical protein [Salm